MKEALKLIQIIEGISHSNPDMLYLQSKANFKSKNYLEALKDINQAMQLKQTKKFYELRAEIYMASYNYEFAIRDYSGVDIDPFNGEVYAKKGLARYNSGDKKGACSDWKKGERYGNYNCIVYSGKFCN